MKSRLKRLEERLRLDKPRRGHLVITEGLDERGQRYVEIAERFESKQQGPDEPPEEP